MVTLTWPVALTVPIPSPYASPSLPVYGGTADTVLTVIVLLVGKLFLTPAGHFSRTSAVRGEQLCSESLPRAETTAPQRRQSVCPAMLTYVRGRLAVAIGAANRHS